MSWSGSESNGSNGSIVESRNLLLKVGSNVLISVKDVLQIDLLENL